ncbi:MAG: glycosyltransferase family 4 protein [Candidatus Nealsonbacteria bacterium]
MRVLFITRQYPPKKGGMEKVAYELYVYFKKKVDVDLIKWGGTNKWLSLVLPIFLLKSIFILLTKKIDVIYLGDGLLAPLGFLLKAFGKKTAITIHALDITYKNRLYQYLIPKCVKRLDKVICISCSTKEECLKRNIPENKIIMIPDGISDEFYIQNKNKEELKNELERKFNVSLKNKKILLSVGRLVERKGFNWFIGNVLSPLIKQREDIIYLIAGKGRFREKIEQTIKENKLENYAKLLGGITDKELKLLYNSADIFLMPNIPVAGDAEGFGIVILEAASCELPVIASNLEGIKDAVKDGENGFLIEPENAEEFIQTINKLLESGFGEKARRFTLENYNWDKISEKYLKVFYE